MWYPIKNLLRLVLIPLTLGTVFAKVEIGQPFPPLSASSLEGKLPELNGQVVLIDFWATWCAPCKASFPAYSKLQTELQAEGFTLLGVSVDKEQKDYDAFLKRFPVSFSTVRDSQQKLVAEVNVPARPTSYLIDKHGVLRAIHKGFHGESTIEEIKTQIQSLLAEK